MRYAECALVALMLSACAPRGPQARPDGLEAFDPRDYQRAVERYTAEDKVYRELETRLLVTGTYRARSLRDAFIDYYAWLTVLGPQERAELREEEQREWEIYHEIVFLAYAPNNRHLDFEDPESVWKLYLYDGLGNRTEPVIVRRLDLSNRTLKVFFPYTENAYGRVYSVKFPREALQAETRTLRFQIAGPLGVAEMAFDRRGEPSPEPKATGAEARLPSTD